MVPHPVRAQKLPVTIDAFRFTGTAESAEAIFQWVALFEGSERAYDLLEYITATDLPSVLDIITLEGRMTAREGWWIIRGVEGEYYPCAPVIFQKTYKILEG